MDPVNQNKLQSFIKDAKAQGMKKDDIKDSLIKAGWKDSDINKLL